MDEEQDDSSPANEREQNDIETTAPGRTIDASRSGNVPDEGGWRYVTQAHYDSDDERDLTTVIVSAIAKAEEMPITKVKSPPLYEVVDVTSIDDALFGRPDANRSGVDSTMEFRYNQYKVRVEADGWVTVSVRGELPAVRKSNPNRDRNDS